MSHTHTQTLYWAVSATAMPYQMRSDQAVIYKAGKREFAGGRKEETCGGRGRQDIALLMDSMFPLLLRCQTTRMEKKKRKEKRQTASLI